MTTADLVGRILEQLGEVKARCPDLRLGQLIAIIGELAQDQTGFSLWDVEDADFAAALERFAADMARRESTGPGPAAATDPAGISSSPASPASPPPRQVS
jgi:hypothetical protein